MGVKISCYTIVIPIRNIVTKFSGGWLGYFRGDSPVDDAYGESLDEYLLIDGAMNALDIQFKISDLKENGLTQYSTVAGRQTWKDFCVLQSFGQSATPCPWLFYDQELSVAHYMEGGRIFPSRFNSVPDHLYAKNVLTINGGEIMALSITEFFSALGFKLASKRWSWGGENSDGKIIFRTWEPDTANRASMVRVLQASDRGKKPDRRKNGLMERIKHLQSIQEKSSGAYTTISNVKISKHGEWSSSGFRQDVVYPISDIFSDSKGDVWANLADPISVSDLEIHSRTWQTRSDVQGKLEDS